MHKAIAGVFLFANIFSGSVLAVDFVGGEVNFSGKIVPQPCKVNQESLNMEVPIPAVTVKELMDNAGKGKAQEFIIGLNCKSGVKETVSVTFKGTQDLSMPGLLQTTGAAKGIALRLLDKSLANLDINTVSKPINFTAGSNDLKFYVRVETLDYTKVSGGRFEAGATFELSYQ